MNVIDKILGKPQKSSSEFEIHRDDFTPQTCEICGGQIKHKDIYYDKGLYWHRECRRQSDHAKYLKRKRK